MEESGQESGNRGRGTEVRGNRTGDQGCPGTGQGIGDRGQVTGGGG